MRTLVKETREVGTSAGVLLPRGWLNKKVVVTLFQPKINEIAADVLNYLYLAGLNKEVKGIYLYGSYARGEQGAESDIDVLVITEKTTKQITSGNYEILLVSEENFSKHLDKNLNYFSILKEAEVILNNGLLEKYRNKNITLNYRKNLAEISRIIKINKDSVLLCRDNNKAIPDGIMYSIVLRARELYLLRCILSEKGYTKKEFVSLIGNRFYETYERVKREEREINNLKAEEVLPLIELSEKWLKELKD